MFVPLLNVYLSVLKSKMSTVRGIMPCLQFWLKHHSYTRNSTWRISRCLTEFSGISKNVKNSHRYRWKFQKNSEILTDIGGNLKITKNLTDISENLKNFKKYHRYRWKFQKISRNLTDIGENFASLSWKIN